MTKNPEGLGGALNLVVNACKTLTPPLEYMNLSTKVKTPPCKVLNPFCTEVLDPGNYPGVITNHLEEKNLKDLETPLIYGIFSSQRGNIKKN